MDPILQLILNQPNGKQLLQNYRQILRHTTFGTNTFRIPKSQACKKMEWVIGIMRPYPYRNEEHVTCKMCSIDLEMYKLVN